MFTSCTKCMMRLGGLSAQQLEVQRDCVVNMNIFVHLAAKYMYTDNEGDNDIVLS